MLAQLAAFNKERKKGIEQREKKITPQQTHLFFSTNSHFTSFCEVSWWRKVGLPWLAAQPWAAWCSVQSNQLNSWIDSFQLNSFNFFNFHSSTPFKFNCLISLSFLPLPFLHSFLSFFFVLSLLRSIGG